MPFVSPAGVMSGTPLAAVGLGVLAGLFATCALSLLSRLLPGLSDLTVNSPHPRRARRSLPDPLDREAVRRWQDDERSPAAHRRGLAPASAASVALPTTPEAALVTDHGPGPEGAAERFAAKVAAGLFNRDLLQREKLAGKLVHFGYGALWGAAYGVLQASIDWPWLLAGVVYGGLVWLVGPAALVPAMKVMLSPRELGLSKSALVVAGHLVYGVFVALLFALLWSGRLS